MNEPSPSTPKASGFVLSAPAGDWAAYEARVERVTAYIHAHMDEPLDLDTLAEVACLSRFHWHRIYRAVQGETVAQTLKRVRMVRAGFDLVAGELSLESVARRSGYPNVRSFSRAFRDVYRMSPGAYRRRGLADPSPNPKTSETKDMHDVTIEDLPDRSVIGLAHSGAYEKIVETFERLVAVAATRGLFPQVRGMVGIYYDDPMSMPEAELRSQAALIVDDTSLAEPPLEAETLAGGRYAVLTVKGPYSELPAAYDWLYSVWLKQEGHAVREAPPYEDYLNNPRDVPAPDLLTKICIPIQ